MHDYLIGLMNPSNPTGGHKPWILANTEILDSGCHLFIGIYVYSWLHGIIDLQQCSLNVDGNVACCMNNQSTGSHLIFVNYPLMRMVRQKGVYAWDNTKCYTGLRPIKLVPMADNALFSWSKYFMGLSSSKDSQLYSHFQPYHRILQRPTPRLWPVTKNRR